MSQCDMLPYNLSCCPVKKSSKHFCRSGTCLLHVQVLHHQICTIIIWPPLKYSWIGTKKCKPKPWYWLHSVSLNKWLTLLLGVIQFDVCMDCITVIIWCMQTFEAVNIPGGPQVVLSRSICQFGSISCQHTVTKPMWLNKMMYFSDVFVCC